MTKEELAALLNGRQYRQEMTKAEEAQAKADGLLVIFGASDDLLEFRGAFDDEMGAYEGTVARLNAERVIPDWESLDKDDEAEVERYFADKKTACTVAAAWAVDGFSWVISTDLPHAPFMVMEDDDTYCRGIVIAVADMA